MKKTVLAILVLSIGIVGLLLIKSPTQGQQSIQQDQKEEATIIKRGKFSEKEKKLSKEYKKLYPNQTQKFSVGVNLAKKRGYKGEVTKTLGLPTIPTLGHTPSKEDFLLNLACKADAIVFGKVNSKVAHLTEDETWVYTEYEFLIKDVLKDNSELSINKGGVVYISRPGGFFKLDGTVFRIKDALYDQLKKNKEYMLFLKFVPSVSGYMPASLYGDFRLQGKKFKPLSKIGLPKKLNGNIEYEILMKDVRTSVLNDCNEKKGGE